MPTSAPRPLLTSTGLLAVTALLGAGCDAAGTAPAPSGSSGPPTASPGLPSAVGATTEGGVRGRFEAYRAGATAITYDPQVVPAGATAQLITMPAAAGVTVKLSVTGMTPNRTYGAHLHVAPCAASPAEAGPHYQHMPDPKAVASPPSVDPKYANPRNEVWLDFTADAVGTGSADATQDWPFDEINPPRSLILHAEQTNLAPGKAGTAGPRVACLTLPG